jgi:predicted nucleic acid-binding protein
MKAVFDTNILIDYLNGNSSARQEISLYDDRMISIITYIETLVGTESEDENCVIQSFLRNFRVLDLSRNIATLAIRIRKEHNLKIPDAIVYATARDEGCILVSRNTKDFNKDSPDIRVPYEL